MRPNATSLLDEKYHTTAELAATTDPNQVFDLRAKLDAAGHYDDFEVERVVAVELDPKAKQSDLVKALSQIFDYGNTGIEKRARFYKRLLPLLEFGRKREAIDLSKVKLTHHTLKGHGKAPMVLAAGEKPLLYPLIETGGGSVQEKEHARLDAAGEAAGVHHAAPAGREQHQGAVRELAGSPE